MLIRDIKLNQVRLRVQMFYRPENTHKGRCLMCNAIVQQATTEKGKCLYLLSPICRS